MTEASDDTIVTPDRAMSFLDSARES